MSADPSRLHPPHRPRCGRARCRVEAALLLLRTGRADMALQVLAPVPDLIVEESGRAFARGHDNAVRGRASGPPPGAAPRARPQAPAAAH